MVQDEQVAMSMIDASTGQAWAVSFGGDGKWASIYDEIMRWNPSELVLTPKDSERVNSCICSACLIQLLSANIRINRNEPLSASKPCSKSMILDISTLANPQALQATALAADYLATVHRHDDIAIRDVDIQETSEGLVLDQTTLRNLEITQTLAGEYEGSLLWAMNKCRTAMGRRCLKSWLLRPFPISKQCKHDMPQ